MIIPSDYTKQKRIYLREGKLYRILAYCPEPSVTMVSINDADDQVNFGLGGLANAGFKPTPLIYNHDSNLIEWKGVGKHGKY